MSAEWVTAIGTLGTFVVITASAIAALIQLRHMRGSNQIIALNEVRETMEAPAFQAAENFVLRELPQRLDDPAVRAALVARPIPHEYESVRIVANFFESFGALVKHGLIDPKIACDLWDGVVQSNWDALRPIVANRRVASPGIWTNFEYLAALAKCSLASHPAGRFPKGIERLALSELWPNVRDN